MTKFEDVANISTEEYFNGNEFSIDAFNKKYAIYKGETYVQALKRVCDYVASAEPTEELRKYWSERWFDEIYNDWWHPAGSIMQGAANPKKISLCNCNTISLGTLDDDKDWDSLEGIIRGALYDVAKAAAYRQGSGIDFSRIRPKDTAIMNSSNISSGVVHWMSLIDNVGYYVGQKGRIPALLFSLNIRHPDILDFIKSKSEFTKIQNANISVQITNDFYEAVEKDLDWELRFESPAVKKGDKIYIDQHVMTEDAQKDDRGWYIIATRDKEAISVSRKIKARELLYEIASAMYNSAEPGIQNIDIARELSNSDAVYDPNSEYDSRIISTNACSEVMLSRDSLCVLSSINCGKFDIDNYEEDLRKIAFSISRFLDNVNTKEIEDNRSATPMQKTAIEMLRRIGAGLTNLSEFLFKSGVKYGSKESIKIAEEFVKKYNYYLYSSTIELGKEKGSFKLFDREKIKKSGFIQKMMKEGLEFTHMRNATVSSIAPTGTLSLMFSNMVLSYGVEPPFGLYYWKRTRISGGYAYYFCVPHVVREKFKEMGIDLGMNSDTVLDTWDGKFGAGVAKIIDKYKDRLGYVDRVDPFDKLELVSSVARHIDSSVSVTFSLDEESTVDDVVNMIMEAYKKKLKNISAFPERKIYGIVSKIPFKDLALSLKGSSIELHPQNFSEEELEVLNISKGITFSSAPKRPRELDAEIYSVSVKGDKFIIAVGLLNGAPYEMFGGAMNGFRINGNKTGKIIKIYKNKYKLVLDDGIQIDDFSMVFTPVEQVLFRLVSANLRHGTPVKFICEQLNKATEDMTSLARAAARVLKKYIKDGEPVTGLRCPSCGSTNLFYQDGCVSCSCGFSKCD